MGVKVIELRDEKKGAADRFAGIPVKAVYLSRGETSEELDGGVFVGSLVGDGYSYLLTFVNEGDIWTNFGLTEMIYGVAEELSEHNVAQTTLYKIDQILTDGQGIVGAVLKQEVRGAAGDIIS